MSEHTQEPWVYDETLPGHFYSDDATGSIIGTCTGFSLAPRKAEITHANARRIVACVNACARISDEELHEADLWQRFNSQSNVIVQVTQQRDELLEALKLTLRWANELECMLLNNAKSKSGYEKMQMIAGFSTDVLRKAIEKAEATNA